MKKIKLDEQYFEKLFQEKFSNNLKRIINEKDIELQTISQEEYEYCIKSAIEFLLQDNVIEAGKHRINQWEKGWGENCDSLDSVDRKEAIIPKYFGKHQFSRLNRKFVKGLSENYDYNMLEVIVDWLFDKYVNEAEISSVYEFGCGTAHHLVRAYERNSSIDYYGLDWATSSQNIIEKLGIPKIHGKQFDYFNPDYNFKIEGGCVYTVASLEQTGTDYKKFIDYLLENNPDICFHIEPIAELLDEENLLDYLSIRYFEKLKYLTGFLDYLEDLEKAGKIEIVMKKRTFIGSMFVDGYSVVAWKKRQGDVR